MDALRAARTSNVGDEAATHWHSPAFSAQAAIRFEEDADYALLWSHTNQHRRPGHDAALTADLATLKAQFIAAFAEGAQPFRHLVMRSATRGIFGLGYDPARLAASIRAGARGGLSGQMRAAALGHHAIMGAFGLPIVTIALVEGDAIGLGFELAIAHDVVIAERSAQFGFPETMFGLFPAAGAASFLVRRVGRAAAERLMLSGQLHDGEELHRLGIVDILAEDGTGESAVRDFVGRHAKRFTMQRAVYAARRRVHPLSLTEIESMCDLWVETALRMPADGVAMLDRLAEAETERLAAARPRG